MSDIWILLVVEDILSEATAEKLLSQSGQPFRVKRSLGFRGIDHIRSRIRNFNEAARQIPVLAIADLDTEEPCPPVKIQHWLGSAQQESNLLLRFAVMEVESWLLAHREAMAQYLKIPLSLVPRCPDAVPQPKERLVGLARRSRSRRIREDIAPRPGSGHRVGPDYNGRLIEFVREYWDPLDASRRSPSLYRALERLRTFRPESPP